MTRISHGQVGGLRDDPGEQVGRGLVHPVHVVEHEQGGRRQHPLEQLLRDGLEPAPPEPLLELLGLGRHRHLDVHGDPQERQPRQEVGGVRFDPIPEATGGADGVFVDP